MNLWQAAILGVVEGVTEYLPVSSTGHLIIASALLGLDHPPQVKHAVDVFNIVIQGGAILAVLGLYRARVLQMLRGVTGRDPAGLRLFRNLAVAFLPAAILGPLLNDVIEERLFHPLPVMAALALGGMLMIGIGRWQRRFFHEEATTGATVHAYTDIEHLSWQRALLIGVAQCLAMWPGTSRSMTTIVGGMIAGMKPRQAAEFSFLLGLPTLAAACGFSVFKDLTGEGPNMLAVLGPGAILVGLVTAAVSAAVAIRWLVGFLNHHGLAPFGWYRLALCAGLATLLWRGVVSITPG